MYKEVFFKYINECRKIERKKSQTVIYYYDKQYIREQKIKRILGIDIPEKIEYWIDDNTGKILNYEICGKNEMYFVIDKKRNSFNISYEIAKKYFYDIKLNSEENLKLFTSWLKDDPFLNGLEADFIYSSNFWISNFSPRGPINKPIIVKSWSEMIKNFGKPFRKFKRTKKIK